MAAKDLFHDAVRHALEKDGWLITHDPYLLTFGGPQQYVDLGAELLLAAEKDKRKIAVEIKSFVSPSAISEFHTALGQFLNYQFALERQEPDRVLYLAVPFDTYTTFFRQELIQGITERYQLKLILYDEDIEEVVTWKE